MAEFRKPIGWVNKFRSAGSGLWFAWKDQNSFWVHLPVAGIVLATAFALSLDRDSICVLLLCIGSVLVAELFNTSIEYLAKAITDQEHPTIGKALDIASGAVLLSVIFSVIIGFVILVPPVLSVLLGIGAE